MVYFVATPIGNLKDISLRALETLKAADVIFCEDTRHTLRLLNAYEIKKPLFACHKFNEREAAEKILALSREGKAVAVASDAGTPVISDPGNVVCKILREAGEAVYADSRRKRVRRGPGAVRFACGQICVHRFFAG